MADCWWREMCHGNVKMENSSKSYLKQKNTLITDSITIIIRCSVVLDDSELSTEIAKQQQKWKHIVRLFLSVWIYEWKMKRLTFNNVLYLRTAEVIVLLFGLTCDICCHQSLSPDDLYLHHTDILQVVERPPQALKHHRDRGQRSKRMPN